MRAVDRSRAGENIVSCQQLADQPVFQDPAEFYVGAAGIDEANCEASETIALSDIKAKQVIAL